MLLKPTVVFAYTVTHLVAKFTTFVACDAGNKKCSKIGKREAVDE